MLLGASWPCASRAAAAQSEGDDDEPGGRQGRAAVAAATADEDMDESSLLDLLECSVCLERLDTTAKVLPCQHTFCRRCLESIVCSRRELRCPECRILVGCGVDDLPANILLVRLLDGIRQRPRAGASPGGSPPVRPGSSSGGASALAGGGGSAAGSAPGSPVFLSSAAGSATASLRELTTSRSPTVAKVGICFVVWRQVMCVCARAGVGSILGDRERTVSLACCFLDNLLPYLPTLGFRTRSISVADKLFVCT
ncbi:PREDICTED: SH3 domain-containing RING finger protein 3-like [Condylura cristata]|uniref:SH3 domain-containing RING finger protein 3-like n=1 Tax=Condylura cristata TaxID=143302 RepID=UPI0006429375|nr:PREDICTED: SH3 domain-containing RING finger protein 3-like [Condylura cristata]